MSITKAIHTLAKSTELPYSATQQVHQAFLLGLWYKQFPDYMVEHIAKCYNFDLQDIDPENFRNWNIEKVYPNLYKFQFLSDTGDAWHQCYRDLRQKGWNRFKVHRKGGRLQYLMEIKQADKPQGFQELWLFLDISIATCKQVQVGTQMVEQPIFETKCEDLIDFNDEAPQPQPLAFADIIAEVLNNPDKYPNGIPLNPGEIQSDSITDSDSDCDCSVDSDRTSQGGPDVGIHTPDCASSASSPQGAEVIPLVVVNDIEELQRRRPCCNCGPADTCALCRDEDSISF